MEKQKNYSEGDRVLWHNTHYMKVVKNRGRDYVLIDERGRVVYALPEEVFPDPQLSFLKEI